MSERKKVEMPAWMEEFDREMYGEYCIHAKDLGPSLDELYATWGDMEPAKAAKQYAEEYDLLPLNCWR